MSTTFAFLYSFYDSVTLTLCMNCILKYSWIDPSSTYPHLHNEDGKLNPNRSVEFSKRREMCLHFWGDLQNITVALQRMWMRCTVPELRSWRSGPPQRDNVKHLRPPRSSESFHTERTVENNLETWGLTAITFTLRTQFHFKRDVCCIDKMNN